MRVSARWYAWKLHLLAEVSFNLWADLTKNGTSMHFSNYYERRKRRIECNQSTRRVQGDRCCRPKDWFCCGCFIFYVLTYSICDLGSILEKKRAVNNGNRKKSVWLKKNNRDAKFNTMEQKYYWKRKMTKRIIFNTLIESVLLYGTQV